MSRPLGKFPSMTNLYLERKYFILDTKRGTVSVFRSLRQSEADEVIVVCQCMMSLESDYSIVNHDIKRKFEIQPVNRDGMPEGDLL